MNAAQTPVWRLAQALRLTLAALERAPSPDNECERVMARALLELLEITRRPSE